MAAGCTRAISRSATTSISTAISITRPSTRTESSCSDASNTSGGSSALAHFDELRAHEFRFYFQIAVLEKHLDDFLEVCVQLVKRLSLCMSSWNTGYECDVVTRVGVSLNDGCKCSPHVR